MAISSLGLTADSLEERIRIENTHPGMAYISGTGPEGMTCGDCKFKGYRRRSAEEKFNAKDGTWSYRFYRARGCAEFYRLAGRHGGEIKDDWHACKYFVSKK